MTSREFFENGEKWTDIMTRDGFPILIAAALSERTITYKDFGLKLNQLHGHRIPKAFRHYGGPAWKIGVALEKLSTEWPSRIPPINILVVNGKSGIPGRGAMKFIDRYLSVPENEESSHDPRAIHQQIWDYHDWNRVAEYFGVKVEPKHYIDDFEPPIVLPKIKSFHGGQESEEHIFLKKWVKVHPELFAKHFGNFADGVNESVIQSGDRLDVLFENEITVLAVEVKAANAPSSEYFRGIFQCVKYRAVLRAVQSATGRYVNAQAALVTQCSLPEEAQRLADRLYVPTIIVKATSV